MKSSGNGQRIIEGRARKTCSTLLYTIGRLIIGRSSMELAERILRKAEEYLKVSKGTGKGKIRAFILLDVGTLPEATLVDAAKAFRAYPFVKRAYVITGEWDIMLEVVVSSMEELSWFVLSELHSFKEVKKTQTIIVFEEV